MIKRVRGALTYLSQEMNGLTRANVVGGINLVAGMDEKIEENLLNKDKGQER